MTEKELEVKRHPVLDVLVREDGMIFNRVRGGHGKKFAWTNGRKNSTGYHQVGIQGKLYLVHRLVAETFIPNPEQKPTVDHINRETSDNRLCNLRWATHKEQVDNTKHVDGELLKYGVRSCENKSDYMRNYMKKYRERKKIEESQGKEKITSL